MLLGYYEEKVTGLDAADFHPAISKSGQITCEFTKSVTCRDVGLAVEWSRHWRPNG